MAFFIAALATEESQIYGSDSVDVSYPGFIGDMKKFGQKYYNISCVSLIF